MKMLKESILNAIKKPFTQKYPKERPIVPDRLRAKHKYDKEKCIYCGLCSRYCPSDAITVDKEKKKWVVDLGRCLFCEQCAEVCPTKCLVLGTEFEIADSDKTKFVFEP